MEIYYVGEKASKALEFKPLRKQNLKLWESIQKEDVDIIQRMQLGRNSHAYNGVKSSPIEGLGLFATKEIKANTFIGITHIRDEQFENKYIRTPLGGFYNHSDSPTVQRMVSNILPTLKFGDPIDPTAKAKKFNENDDNLENMYYNLREKPDAKYFFMVSIKDLKPGDELCANYNLYTYPKTGVGVQML